MIGYLATKKQFIADIVRIPDLLRDTLRKNGVGVSPSEYSSWEQSLGYIMANLLRESSLPDDVAVAAEFRPARRKLRIDLMIGGRDKDGRLTLIIIELKQWTKVEASKLPGYVRTFLGRGKRDQRHPCEQASGYADTLGSFYETVEAQDIRLVPCAFLHGCDDDTALRDPQFQELTAATPLFVKRDRDNFKNFLEETIIAAPAADIFKSLDGSAIRPSRTLADSLVRMFDGNKEFVLFGQQQRALDTIMKSVGDSGESGKRVVLIEGGPGTGKSVLAISALVQLIDQDVNAIYATKNSAPREVYRLRLKGTRSAPALKLLFANTSEFAGFDEDEIAVTLADEAHRLVRKAERQAGKNQVMEIIRASRVSVFFLDENQHVTFGDIGTRDEIEKWAAEAGADFQTINLVTQFRCGTSDHYVAWVDALLGLTDSSDGQEMGDYDVRVIDDPVKLRKLIKRRNSAGRSRLLAGYCWNWDKSANAPDITIPGTKFAMHWNLVRDGQAWIEAPDSINTVGCIHTIQGLEGDYFGVIIGPDLAVQDGRLVGRREYRAKTDQALRGLKKALKDDPLAAEARAERLIRTTYRTLLTRGMKGTYIFCTDPDVANFIRARLPSKEGEALDGATPR